MITQLGYVGFGVNRVDDWIRILSDIFGMAIASRSADGSIHLSMDDRTQRVSVHPGVEDDVTYLGWQTESPSKLEALVAKVEEYGIKVERGDAKLAEQRCVQGLAWFIDPSGLRTELFWGPKVNSAPFIPARAISGFRAGGLGVGHAVVATPNRDIAERFYVDVLGFRVSDYGSGPLVFMRCNSRHHSLALIPDKYGFAGKKMVHLMIEVNTLDDLGTCFDLCVKRGVPIAETIGKHVNDQMISFYAESPGGFGLEYGWGGCSVDEATWEIKRYQAKDIWGHTPISELIADLSTLRTNSN